MAKGKLYSKKVQRKRAWARARRLPFYMKSSQSGFPSTKVCKFRYNHNVGLDIPASGVIVPVAFRCNSPYDPYEPQGGHQPLGWDEWSLFYKRQVVLRAKITVALNHTFSATESTGVGVFGVMLSNDPQISATPTTVIEQGTSKWKYFRNTSNQRTLYVTHSYNPKSHFSIKDIADNEARIGSLVAGLAAQQAYFVVFVGSVNANDMQAVNCDVTIEYDVLFSQPEQLIAS